MGITEFFTGKRTGRYLVYPISRVLNPDQNICVEYMVIIFFWSLVGELGKVLLPEDGKYGQKLLDFLWWWV